MASMVQCVAFTLGLEGVEFYLLNAPKISSYLTLHLIKVGKAKGFKQEISDLKTIITPDLRFVGLRQPPGSPNMSIMCLHI